MRLCCRNGFPLEVLRAEAPRGAYGRAVCARHEALCFSIARAARWKNLMQAQQAWPSAEAVGEFTVFNIKGNTYRLIARINYRSGTIFIRAVMAHAKYSKGKWR
jgi:mRNA interferase HigB